VTGEALRFHDAATWNDLGTAPCVADIPAEAWAYGAVCERVDFAALNGGAVVRLVLRVEGTPLGVSIVSEDGAALLTEELCVHPGPALQSVVLHAPAAVASGLLLLRNYDGAGQGGRVDISEAVIDLLSPQEAADLAALWSIFDTGHYLERNPDLGPSRESAFAHYLRSPPPERGEPNALFDSAWYLRTYPDARGRPGGALGHYLSIGAAQDHDPSADFASRWYRQENALEPTVGALSHYLRLGRQRGLPPNLDAMDYRLRDLRAEGAIMPAQDWLTGLADAHAGSRVILPLESLRHGAQAGGAMLCAAPDDPSPEACPSPYVADLRDVIGQGGGQLLVTAQGLALHDELAYVDAHYAADSKSYAVARLPDRRILLRAAAGAVPTVSGIHLMDEFDANYFHWVAEVLPRLFVLAESGALAALPDDMPLLLTAGLAPQMLELLGYLPGGERPRLTLERDHLYRAERLVYPGPVARVLNNYYRPPSSMTVCLPVPLLGRMAAAIKGLLSIGDARPWRSIYLRRKPGARTVLNQPQLESALVAEGFEIIDAAALGARQQVELFSQCSRIVAPSGAAVTNILWCSPGAQVRVLHAAHVAYGAPIWDGLAQASSADCRSIACQGVGLSVGRNGVNDDFVFPLERLGELL
jgi:capsular polysaccharide biosynthesis protein